MYLNNKTDYILESIISIVYLLVIMEKQFLERLELQMDLKGVFCLPSEWKTSDESNPSQFDYSISFSKVKMEKGHYCAREASE